MSRVLAREADLGFGSDIGQKHSELATEALFSEAMALFVREDHPLARQPWWTRTAGGPWTFIHVNRDAYGLARHQPRSSSGVAQVLIGGVVQHVSMLSTAFGMVQSGAGVALLPRYVEILDARQPEGRGGGESDAGVFCGRWAIGQNYLLSPAAMAFLA